MAMTNSKFGLNGRIVRMFLEWYYSVVQYWAQHTNVILPGEGLSKETLQTVSDMEVLPYIALDTDDVPVLDPITGYETTLEAPRRGGQRRISRVLMENLAADKSGLVALSIQALAKSGPFTLNYLFRKWLSVVSVDGVTAETGLAGGDGKAFFDSAHPLYSGSADTNNNINASATPFGAVGINELIVILAQQKDMKGNVMDLGSNFLIVHGPLLIPRVLEYLGSTQKPFEASNTVNLARGQGMTFTNFINPDFTGATKQYYYELFDLDRMRSPAGLNVKVMRAPGMYSTLSEDGEHYIVTETLRAGIGHATTTFGAISKAAS